MALILDWARKPKTTSMRKYVKTIIVDGREELHYKNPVANVSECITFRNFPQLHIEKDQMLDCTFENCGTIYFSAPYPHAFCTFRNIKALFCRGEELFNCHFNSNECTEGALVSLYNCRMKSCHFDNIKLSSGALLVEGKGRSRISYCRFNNVIAEEPSEKWFFCENPEAHVLTKAWPKPVFYDYNTCCITDQSDKADTT